VIDYGHQDFTENGERYDVIFDIFGRLSFAGVKNSLNPTGLLLYVSYKSRALLEMLWTSLFSDKKVICAMADERIASLELVKSLAESGKIKAVIDKQFPLDQTAEAHRYIEAGEKRGSVVISVPE
jgi:NADPH:quinone reductase-like Zn-dependent oxidoreductase